MEIEREMKRRSYRSCISTAFNVVARNLWKITKGNWRWFLALAVVEAAVGVALLNVMRGVTYVGFGFDWVKFCLCMVLLVACNVTFTSLAFRMINGKGLAWNAIRCIKTIPMLLIYFLIFIVIAVAGGVTYLAFLKDPSLIVTPEKIAIASGISVLTLVVAAVFFLPLSMVFCKYMANPETKLLKIIWPTFAAGMRAWGFIFVTMFLASLCSFIVYFTVGLPELLLNFVNNISAYGTASLGDPSGLPASFTFLYFVVGFVECFVKLYVALFIVFVMYYASQTVECKAQDRLARREVKRKEKGFVEQ